MSDAERQAIEKAEFVIEANKDLCAAIQVKNSFVQKLRTKASKICDVLDAIDNRCAAADGPVTPTMGEATGKELRSIYKAADAIRKMTQYEGLDH